MNDKFCFRDWLDIHSLILNKKYLRDIVNIFVEKIRSNKNDAIIIGIDSHGLLLASILAFRTGMPFTYVISKDIESYYTPNEKKVNIRNGQKIILITDVIISGNTLVGVIEALKNTYNIDDKQIQFILALFHRKPCKFKERIEFADLNFYKDNIFVLNNDIDVEICYKDNCIFKENKIIKHKHSIEK